jgi:CubicO group peptidase (beta-lactamase class C family)
MSAELELVVAGVLGGYRAPGAVVVVGADGGAVDVAAVNVEPDALFMIGSITKVMTAVLVMQHVERGELDLDDSFVKHVPEFALDPIEATPSVTIRHLLTHTSGIDCGDELTDTGDDDECLARYVAGPIAGSRLLFAPGERWSYNNGAFVLLGRLVEELDGRPWDDALIDRIFKPLGMTATTNARLAAGAHLTRGHRYDPEAGRLVVETRRFPRCANPAGGAVVTAEALLRFATGFFAGELVGPDTVSEMIRPHASPRDGGQGLGWQLPAPGVVGHGGATPGSSAAVGAVPGVGALAILANGPGVFALSNAVQAHLFGTSSEAPVPARGNGADIDRSMCIGRYECRYVRHDIVSENDELVATTTYSGPVADLLPQPQPVELRPHGGGRFLSRQPWEDGTTVWDFAADSLFTDRLLKRA